MSGRFHYWDEFIGSGRRPVKTRRGWLHVYHGIATHFGSATSIKPGVSLLDLGDPSRLVGPGRAQYPRAPGDLRARRAGSERRFPSGMIVEEFDAEGFACPQARSRSTTGRPDTVVGLAVTTIGELVEAASESPF